LVGATKLRRKMQDREKNSPFATEKPTTKKTSKKEKKKNMGLKREFKRPQWGHFKETKKGGPQTRACRKNGWVTIGKQTK